MQRGHPVEEEDSGDFPGDPASLSSRVVGERLERKTPGRWNFLPPLLRKAGLTALAAAGVGVGGAGFGLSLDAVTHWRISHPQVVWCLPPLGLAVVWLYRELGGSSKRGTALVIEEIERPQGGVPARMAPLIVVGTLATHLGGGSAGREGTALQMGAGLAGAVGSWTRSDARTTSGLMMAGMAAGLGSVFGTPWAGSVLAIEVLGPGREKWKEWPWCLAAAWIAEAVSQAMGFHHYPWQSSAAWFPESPGDWIHLAVAAVALGGLARGFVSGLRNLQDQVSRRISRELLRPVVCGLLVIGLIALSGSRDYLGLGTIPPPGGLALPSFVESGVGPAQAAGASAWKLLFTAVTLAGGFKGGEVTPLFFMGASAGCALSALGPVPSPVLAAIGMMAVFGAAARVPAAAFVMGMELFGTGLAVPMALGCFLAWTCNSTGLWHEPSPRKAASEGVPEGEDRDAENL